MPEEKNRDFRFAFQCAESFLNLATPYLTKMGVGLNEGPLVAKDDPGGLVCSATNLTFAIELYLKSLRIGLELGVPSTHNLWELYKSLPNNAKQIIETKYDDRVSKILDTDLFELSIALEVATPDGPTAPEFPNNPDEAKDLRSLLQRTNNAFQTWRYLYEAVEPGERYFIIKFEYSHLLVLCHSIREHIQENDPKNRSSH